MKLVKLSGVGIKPRPIWINPAHVVQVTTGFEAGTTEVTTLATGERSRISVSETAEQVVQLLHAADPGGNDAPPAGA